MPRPLEPVQMCSMQALSAAVYDITGTMHWDIALMHETWAYVSKNDLEQFFP